MKVTGSLQPYYDRDLWFMQSLAMVPHIIRGALNLAVSDRVLVEALVSGSLR